jgi:hypothetical protein
MLAVPKHVEASKVVFGCRDEVGWDGMKWTHILGVWFGDNQSQAHPTWNIPGNLGVSSPIILDDMRKTIRSYLNALVTTIISCLDALFHHNLCVLEWIRVEFSLISIPIHSNTCGSR